MSLATPTLPDESVLLEAGSVSTSSLSRRVLSRPGAVAGLMFLALIAAAGIAAPWVAPYGFNEQVLVHRHMGPGATHWLGADEFGRDVLTRLLYGGRNSLFAAVLATLVAVAIGMPMGLVAGFGRGVPDQVLSRISETVQVVPPILLALAVIAVLGRGLTPAMLAVGFVSAPRVFRIVRAATMAAAAETYVDAARSVGGSRLHILRRHVLPTITSPLLVECVYLMSVTLLVEAALAYLGLSTQPPATSWGDLLSRGIPAMEDAPHLVVVPGLMIFAAVVSFNAIGDALRSALRPGDAR